MGRAIVPEPFETMTRTQILKIIKESALGREDTKIAKLYLIDKLPQADIAAAMNYERSTISRRLQKITYKITAVADSQN